MMKFKDRYKDLQILVQEYVKLNAYNRAGVRGEHKELFLFFSEAATSFVVLERFLRILPDLKATDGDTFRPLLERAIGKKLNLLSLLKADFEFLVSFRNGFLHGNFEQISRARSASNKEEYFKKYFRLDLDRYFQLINGLLAQISTTTGERLSSLFKVRTFETRGS